MTFLCNLKSNNPLIIIKHQRAQPTHRALSLDWIPASAGMTGSDVFFVNLHVNLFRAKSSIKYKNLKYFKKNGLIDPS